MTTERFKSSPKVLEVARRYIGVVERPVNRTIFGEWYRLNGAAWCAIWVSFVHWFGGLKIPPIQTKRGSAYVPDFVNHAKKTGQWRSARSDYIPKVTDLVVFWMTTRPDHIGIVEMVYGRNDVGTIEGNTNAAGSRTGGMVARLRRRSKIHGYICVDNEVKDGIDYTALRRWLAAVSLQKVQVIKTPLKKGSRGDDVKALQGALNLARNLKIAVDGVYGDVTLLHVAALQNDCKAMGLPIADPPGVFGDTTKWWFCFSLRNIQEGRA